MNKKHLIYIGNQLMERGGNPTSVDVLAPLFREEGYKVTTASGQRNKFLRIIHMILVILKNSRTADGVLIDTYSTVNFWYAYLSGEISRILGLKYILLLHGGELPKRITSTPKKTLRLLNNAHLKVSPSEYLKKSFLKAGINDIKYIPNTLNLSSYPIKWRQSFRPKLLWVRAFSEIYDPLMAVKALELLLKNHRKAELCMVGPAKDNSLKECQKYVQKNNLPVRFTGMLEKRDWHILAADFDIFLNTSRIDNTPVSVIEAMAMGLPVVSTHVGGIPYLIEDQKDGLLVPANDPFEMAVAIQDLLLNPEKTKKIVFSARKKVENFDWKIVKELWNEVLEENLGKPQS